MTYRTGNHWGVTIVRETDSGPSASDYVCDGCGGQAEVWIDDRPLCRREPEVRADSQLVAVVVNGDQALAARIAALLTIDERCWHGEHCNGSGPDCERDAPLKGGHRDCAAAWHANHGCCTEPYDGDAPETGLRSTESAQGPPVGGSGRPGGVEALSGGCPEAIWDGPHPRRCGRGDGRDCPRHGAVI